ncbi:MAG TPA: amidohydrolase family protein, partial [candidate division Zixibacteria bacterium]|nr:amidohydrolase family protein [candidate division Zixibacteria bacterium]
MKSNWLIFNARIYPQVEQLVVNSIAIKKNRIVAIGNDLERQTEFKSFQKINLKGKTLIPGLVDAHTHFHYFALSFGRVQLEGVESLDKCLDKIKSFASHLDQGEWLLG